MSSFSQELVRSAAVEYVANLSDEGRALFLAECGIEQSKPTRLLDVSEVASIMSCTTRTVRKWIADGALPVIRRGRLVRVREDILFSVKPIGGAQ